MSKTINHLLKSPFCVHPKTGKILWFSYLTGRVCIPINPEKIEEFNPLEVPTLSQILSEYNKNREKAKEEQNKVESKK